MVNAADLLWDLDRVDWAQAWTATGSGESIPQVLRTLSVVDAMDAGWEVYWQLDNVVVVQNTLYPAAEYVVPFLLRLAAFGDQLPRLFAIELLIQIAAGEGDPSASLEADRTLGDRCRNGIRRGIECFYALVRSQDPEVRVRALYLIDLVEVDRDRLVWTLDSVASTERDHRARGVIERMRDQR